MKIVFFGTSEFAMPALRALSDSPHKILALVTQPDKKRGRSLNVEPPPTKVLAMTKGIPVFQPDNASSAESEGYLKGLGADLFVVISFGQILKKNILDIPRQYSINLHGSLLPRYRGAAPTNWAIINCDKSTGITIIMMNEGLDEGDIISTCQIAIDDDDTNITLSEKLADKGAVLLLETIDKIEADKIINPVKQDDLAVTYAPKLKKKDGLIDWSASSANIRNKVRGLLPWPGAYTHYEGRILKILQAEQAHSNISPKEAKYGQVLEITKGKGIIVRSGSGDIAITRLQLEGKKVLDSDSFVRGHRIPAGYMFR